MGAYLSEPMTSKQSEDGEGNNIKFGSCSMQGWRVSQEDAHSCVANFDEKSSLFAVYDGHGGAEVAIYLSRHLPEVLKNCAAYQNGEFVKALEECFLKIDESIKTPEVIKEIQMLAKATNDENEATVDYAEENVGALYEEATMPLDKLVAKYQSGSAEESVEDEDPDCKPGSSKSITGGSSSVGSSSSSKSAEASQSSSSAGGPGPSSSSSEAAASSGKANGGSEAEPAVGSSTDEPNRSESMEVAGSDEKVKTVEENGCAPSESNIELIIEGKKIELAKEEGSDKGKAASPTPIAEVSQSEPVKAVNGTSSPEKGENEKIQANSESEAVSSTVNGSSKSEADDVSSSSSVQPAAAVSSGEVSAGSSTPETPRRKKVHPVPIVMENSKQERRSPRKNQQKSFECSDSDDSDDEDDADAGFNEEDSDSDEEGMEEEDSSDDDDDEEEYEEDEDEDERFLNDVQEPGYDSGCTAVVCYMKWEADSLSVWVANAGDSRCVVCRDGEAVDMSHDHKPESEAEAKRIVKAGGKVTEDGRVNGGLNLSRAIGDHSYKQNTTLPPEEQMISPLPTVEHIVLNPTKDKFIVLACDGIWNSMTSQEVVDFVSKRLDKSEPLSKICEELFETCLSPDTCGDGTGCDNMTAIIVKLTGAGEVFSGSKRKFKSGEDEDEGLEKADSTKKSRAE